MSGSGHGLYTHKLALSANKGQVIGAFRGGQDLGLRVLPVVRWSSSKVQRHDDLFLIT